jgi:hypothetical protein
MATPADFVNTSSSLNRELKRLTQNTSGVDPEPMGLDAPFFGDSVEEFSAGTTYTLNAAQSAALLADIKDYVPPAGSKNDIPLHVLFELSERIETGHVVLDASVVPGFEALASALGEPELTFKKR